MPGPRALTRYWGVIPVALAAGLLALRALVATPPLARLAPDPSTVRDPPGSSARRGSLDIARGGPVIVGFQSARTARLAVGTHELVGAGLVTQMIVLHAGPIAIRLAGDARLVWSPVGRRGDPEYVPASSLSPDPPARATFPADAGAAPLDGAIALALLVLLVASLCMLARRRLAAVPRDVWLAMGAVLVVACVVRWIDLSAHGQTWDEDVNWAAGRNYVTNLLALDFHAASWRWNFEHPPIMKYLEGIGALFADGYGPARALSAVWISLGCALLVPIGARLFRLRVGVLAAAIAALLPPLVAHGQIVGHESPAVLWWSLAIVLALGVFDALPEELAAAERVFRRRLVVVGVAIGIAFASRFPNGLVGPLCLVIIVAQAPPAWRRFALRAGLAIMPLVALATLYVVWPRLWAQPIAALVASFHRLDRAHGVEPFLGAITNHPPPWYFLPYLAATLPAAVLAAALGGFVRLAHARGRAALIVLAWLVIPLAVAASPVRQDGVRYVLPCVTALALVAALGIDALAAVLEARGRRAVVALAAAVLAWQAVALVRIAPYYLDFFGAQVGGPGTVAAHRWFETAWWGEGLDRAVAYVNAHAAPNARVYRGCVEPAHLTWFREDLWAPMVATPDAADWIVTYAPATSPCRIPAGMHRVFAVSAEGAVLAEAWRR